MSKVLKTAAIVVGAVALVATGIGAAASIGAFGAIAAGSATAATLATIGTIATVASFAAGALTAVAALTAKKPTATATGSQEQFSADPDAGIPLALGRTGTAGNIGFRRGFDTNDAGDNDRQAFVSILSLGPIAAIEGMTVDKVPTFFGGTGAAIGAFAGFMWSMTQLGALPEPAALSFGAGAGTPPGWTQQHKLSGLAAASWMLRFDTKAKVYQAGVPAPMWTVKGALAYDPTKDSTYPGGSGPHRMADPSDTPAYDAAVATWEWTEDPYLLGLRWAHGFWQRDPSVPGSAYQRVMGMGAPWAGIDVAAFVEGRNIAKAAGWTCGGIIFSGDDKWASMKKILQAGMGEPLALGARISCLVNAPKVSLATITIDDVVGEASVSATQPRRDRFNTVTPRYRLEANNWQLLPGAPISVPEHVAEDRGKRSKVLDYPFIQNTPQVATAARYDIENAREFGPITLPLKLVWMGYKPGDCVTANLPEVGLNNQPILLLNRDLDPSAGVTTMTARSETAAKHSFALGQTATPPPTPGVTGPMLIPIPGAAAWTISGTSIVSGDATVPALIVTGGVDAGSAEAVVLEYRPFVDGQAAGAGWAGAGVFEPTLTRQEIVSVQGGTTYEVAVRYRRQGFTGDRRVIGPVLTGGTKLDFSGVTGPTRPADNATNSADPNSPFGDGTVAEAVATLDRIEPIEAKFPQIESDISAIRDAQSDTETGLEALNTALSDSVSALELINVGTDAALAALARVDADQGAALRQIDRDRLTLSEAVARVLSEADRTRAFFRDAGFYQDAATGKVGMYAVDEQGGRVARAEVLLQAQSALITTKASVNQVNELIALAVLDPVQAAELRPLIARLSAAETTVDGLNALVRQAASLTELTRVDGRVTTVEQSLDAVEAAVTTKVERTDFDALGSVVGGVQQTLESLGDVSHYAIDIRQAQALNLDNAVASLGSAILADTSKRQLIVAQASARQEMFAKVEDVQAAEAQARTALSVKIVDLDARSVQETTLRIAGEKLTAERIDALGLANEGQSAEIASLTQASLVGKVGLAGITTTVRQQAADNLDAAVAALSGVVEGEKSNARIIAQLAQFQSEVTTTFTANESASVLARQALLARMGGFDAALVTVNTVVADNDSAAASRFVAIETALSNPLTGLAATRVRINAVENASTTRDEALGERIDSIETVVFDNATGLPAQLALITRNEAARVGMDTVLAEDIAALGVVQQGQAAEIATITQASIANGVGIAGVTTTIRQAIDADAEGAFAALASVVAGEKAGQRYFTQLAQFQSEVTTTLTANEAASIVARQALLVRMAGFDAALVTTNTVIADTEKSLVRQIRAAEAVLNDVTTGLPATRSRLIVLEENTATALDAQGHRLDLIDTALYDPRTGASLTAATVAADVKAVSDEAGATASDLRQLTSVVNDPTTGLQKTRAELNSLGQTVADDRQASAQSITDVRATITTTATSVAATAEQKRAEGEGRLSSAIDANGKAVADLGTLTGQQMWVEKTARELADEANQRAVVAVDGRVTDLVQVQANDNEARAEAIRQVTARLNGNGVTIEEKIQAVVEATGKITGIRTTAIDINGNLVGWQVIGSEDGPGSINLINADLRMGTGRIILNTGSFMQVNGLGFGRDGDLIEWFGPTMAISQCSRANGVTYKTLTGIAYFGGGLSAGVIKNAVQTTSVSPGAILESGVFGSNGRTRRVVVSYNWSSVAEIDHAQQTGSGQISAQLLIYRGSVQIGTLDVTGTWERQSFGGSADPARYEEDMGGAVTLNDASGGTSVEYRVVLASRTLGPGPAAQPYFDSQAQVISLIQTEE